MLEWRLKNGRTAWKHDWSMKVSMQQYKKSDKEEEDNKNGKS